MTATASGLSADQKRALRDDGFLIVRQAVPAELARGALRAINHDLGRGIDPAKLALFHAQSFCPDITATPPLLDLFHASPARAIAEAAIGPLKPVDSSQCALRWPRAPREREGSLPNPHLDGMYSPNNGVPPGTLWNFTALLCVLLSDLPTPDAGNFTVWPGSHRAYERHAREHGVPGLLTNPKLDLAPPLQITGRAGDVVLAQYLLGHTVAPNLSPHVRYAVFFRLHSTALNDENRAGAITDAWRDWAGMRGPR